MFKVKRDFSIGMFMKGMVFTRRKSLGVQLVVSFVITSMIPLVLVNLFSYCNISKIVNENHNELMRYNLNRTKTALDISMESYEDILYQIYENDEIVNLINRINRGDELAASKNQLRRALRGYLYAKDDIRDITVITENGMMVFYDSVTGSTIRNVCIDGLEISREKLYSEVAANNQTSVISTGNAVKGSNTEYFLFHLGHRVVDFKKWNQRIGVVILSIDEKMLENICTKGDGSLSAYNFIIDRQGKLVSYKKKELLGSLVYDGRGSKRKGYEEFAKGQEIFGKDAVTIVYLHDERFGWDIVNVSSQKEVMEKIGRRQRVLFTLLAVSLISLILLIAFFIRRLTSSIKSVVKIMQSAGEGRVKERVQIDTKMPAEVEVIARQYNAMMDHLTEAMEKEKLLADQKKDAEIMALEAQLNPHFLYNTLDTINWIAIGKKEFEVSRAITALAEILRYGIDNSNGIVTIREEYEWMRQYLLLQQILLKDGMEISIQIPPEVMDVKVHKLLFQPFVENSFVHGFKGIRRKPALRISVGICDGSKLKIVIEDNGKGMPAPVVEAMNRWTFTDIEDTNHIGVKNVLYRMKLYYGDEAKVYVEAKDDEYTRVSITIPAADLEERQIVESERNQP